MLKVIILPGNGCDRVRDANWYAWLEKQLQARDVEVVLRDMPDPYVARESIWLPFVKEKMLADSNTIVVGHSSGAVAALRLAEDTKLAGIILVSACHTDLGDANERASGYYSRPWKWDSIKANVGFIHQFHSEDDHLIPVEEARFVAKKLEASHAQYTELQDRSHFFDPFPELLEVLESKLQVRAT